MIRLVATTNPFEPHRRLELELPAGKTVRECVALAKIPSGMPVIVGIDGDWRLRAQWDEPVPEGALVQVEGVIAGSSRQTGMWIGAAEIVIGAIILAYTGWTGAGAAVGYGLIIAGVASFAGSLLVHTPRLPSPLQSESGSPTYSLAIQNRKRNGEPIPVLYGRHRIIPDLVSSPYVEYITDDQYLYMVMCLGQGYYEIEDLRIADSDLDRLQSLSYQVLNPGQPLTLFRDNVSTSTIVQGQTLRPTNEVIKPGNIRFQFITSGGVNAIAQDPVTAGTFTGVAPGDFVTVTNALNAGGYSIVGVNGSASQIFVTHALITENANAAGLNFSAVGTDIPAGDVSFVASTRTITDPTKKRFLGWKPGDQIAVTLTDLNNNSLNIETVAADGSSVVVSDSVFDEFNANPDLEISSGGFVGPFPACAPGVELNSIGVDVIFAKGLTNNGANYSVTVQVQARQIDDDGNAIGGFVTLGTETITRASFSPVRVSYEYANPFGTARAEVKVKRTTSSVNSIIVLEDTTWAGLRGYLPNVGTYPGVTILAIKVRASEQISADAAQQINVVATRILQRYVADDAIEVGPTRNPAWALQDALTDTTYGAGLPLSRIDLVALNALAATWEARGDYFDGVFDQTTTIWDALTKIARAGRAIPIIVGGLVTFVRDDVRTSRTALYAPSHMAKDSFVIEYQLKKEDDPDGIELAWMDPATWQPAHIETTLTGGTPDRPAAVDLFGVTDEDQANREALYLCRIDAYQRKVIRFSTELDGHIPLVGDRIAISHDVPSWGQSGHLLGASGTRYTTTEPLVWTPSTTHYVAFRRPNGSLCGPFVATQVMGDDKAFDCATALDFTARTTLANGDRTAFLFGPGTNWALDVIVTRITPRDDHTVELTCQPYDTRIYAAGV